MDSGPATCQSQAPSCPKISGFQQRPRGRQFQCVSRLFLLYSKAPPSSTKGKYNIYLYQSAPLISFTINRNDFAPDTSVQCQISLKLIRNPPSTAGTVSRTSWGFYNLHMQHALWYPTRPKGHQKAWHGDTRVSSSVGTLIQGDLKFQTCLTCVPEAT